MKAIVFDVDDTIYDQQVVFDQACRDVFGELKGVSLVDLFKANRYYSDESFDAMGRGKMTKEEMYIYRIKRAMEEFHLPITDEQAVRYQERYVYYGTQITVSDQMRQILEYCGEADEAWRYYQWTVGASVEKDKDAESGTMGESRVYICIR